jgi:single-stranded DNA-binding protein
MRDIATATLSGNLTREVELKALPSGTDVARLPAPSHSQRIGGRGGLRTCTG